MPQDEAVRLALGLNQAKRAPRNVKCPPSPTQETWLFRADPPVLVKAGWCDLVVGQDHAVQAPSPAPPP
ncbi:hypothetical protein [Actinomadura sp. 3N508]|uniref:hypothetical protein n=1 Tax=Actinomadura sp. 3N508 TaxID=3375153 RepID=UPI0037B3BE31